MIKSAVSDIVAGSVSTEDPLAACRDVLLEFEKCLAGIASTCLHERNEGVADFAGNCIVALVVKPFLEECLHLLAAALACQSLGHKVSDSLTDALGTESHSKTELAEILEQGVGPCRTMSMSVSAIWRCRE